MSFWKKALITSFSLMGGLNLALADEEPNPFVYKEQDHGFYLRLAGGYTQLNDDHEDWLAYTNGVVTYDENIVIDYKKGYSAEAAAGYRFLKNWRVELDYSYLTNNIDEWYIVRETNQIYNGYVNSQAMMVNGFYDYTNQSRYTPYFGAGIGYLYSNIYIQTIFDHDGGNYYNGSTSNYALQGIVGLATHVAEGLSVTLDYRYLYSSPTDINYNNSDGGTKVSKFGYSNNIVSLGILYKFA